MSGITNQSCKMCRREGVSVCGRSSCAVKRRPTPPGVHGPKGFGKPTGYGLQLREKQKVKRTYGLRERQFHNYYVEAIAKKGDTGQILSTMLETRLDAMLVRAGFGRTHAQARQFVGHGLVMVDGKKVDIPSYRVRPGQVVAFKRRGGELPKGVKIVLESMGKANPPEWLAVKNAEASIAVVRLPKKEELPIEFNMRSIVEFYSR